ncbi:MAG: regulatory protein RecX [Oscillospiraceae bacterium]|nr:regulatory protein RecX [Oscillospiraceae bacterium]
MRITSLKQTSPSRVTVCLDDGAEIKSTLTAVTELRLFTGRELDGTDLEALVGESRRALAREKALELVSQRQMSAKELAKKLRDKGFDEETADYCTAWAAQRGFLDEERYAAAVVRHYAAKGYGEGRVRQELIRRGVPRELWEDALSAMPEDTSKLDRYIASRLKNPEDRDEVRKLSASLFRRGYAAEEIRSALDRFRAAYEYED